MHDLYPGDHSHDPSYGEAWLAPVETIEALPHSEAFEQLMYDHRVRRSADHVMKAPLTIPERFLQADIPEEVRACLPATRPVIENLHVTQTELAETPATLEVNFTSNDCRHTLVTQDERTRYSVENIDGASHTYVFESDVSSKLLAALLYVRLQTRDTGSSAENTPIDYQTNDLELPRSPVVSRCEMFIKALGALDGSSSVETVSTFRSGDKMIAAKLTEIEHPTFSGLQSKLELNQIDDLSDLSTLLDEKPHTDLHQNFSSSSMLGSSTEHELRFAQQYTAQEYHYIDPKNDFAQWAAICDEFLTVLEDEINRQADESR